MVVCWRGAWICPLLHPISFRAAKDPAVHRIRDMVRSRNGCHGHDWCARIRRATYTTERAVDLDGHCGNCWPELVSYIRVNRGFSMFMWDRSRSRADNRRGQRSPPRDVSVARLLRQIVAPRPGQRAAPHRARADASRHLARQEMTREPASHAASLSCVWPEGSRPVPVLIRTRAAATPRTSEIFEGRRARSQLCYKTGSVVADSKSDTARQTYRLALPRSEYVKQLFRF